MEKQQLELKNLLQDYQTRIEQKVMKCDLCLPFAKEPGAKAYSADVYFYHHTQRANKLTDQERIDNTFYRKVVNKVNEIEGGAADRLAGKIMMFRWLNSIHESEKQAFVEENQEEWDKLQETMINVGRMNIEKLEILRELALLKKNQQSNLNN